MATILESIGDYLVTNSYGTLGTNIFLQVMPETPDVCLAVYENSGSSPEFTMGSGGIVIDYPMLQIVSRAGREDYPTARDTADSIRNLLSSMVNVTISSVNIMRIEPMGAVNFIGVDNKYRPLVSVNYRCLVRK
jgi:hypothetical protein